MSLLPLSLTTGNKHCSNLKHKNNVHVELLLTNKDHVTLQFALAHMTFRIVCPHSVYCVVIVWLDPLFCNTFFVSSGQETAHQNIIMVCLNQNKMGCSCIQFIICGIFPSKFENIKSIYGSMPVVQSLMTRITHDISQHLFSGFVMPSHLLLHVTLLTLCHCCQKKYVK